jgi:hypothetical protein
MGEHQAMSEYDVFHDGFVEGFLIKDSQLIIFLRTWDKKLFALIADDVEGMRADNFKEGNIIFDIVVRQGLGLIRGDMDGYDFVASSLGESQRTAALERSRSENRLALEISSSYGCTCILTASSVKLLARSDVITLALC